MSRLTLEEQTTTIKWNKISDNAIIETSEPTLKTKLRKLAEASPDTYILLSEDNYFACYTLPKRLVVEYRPRKKRTAKIG